MLRSLGEVRDEGERKGDKTEGTSWVVVVGERERERKEVLERREERGGGG